MWWRKFRLRWRRSAQVAVVLAATGLVAGCFQPLYGTRPGPGGESVRDKMASVEIPPIRAANGSPEQRVAVAVRNALQFDLNGAAGAVAPTHRLTVSVSTTQLTIVVDPNSGRPTSNIDYINASYEMIEIATGKTVVSDSTWAHVDNDVPGPEQRFASQRGRRDAEDRAVELVASTIRNRLASYFVAGT